LQHIPSPWNEFKVLLGTVPKFFITNKLVISTRGCSINCLGNSIEERQKLIFDLHSRGLSNDEIVAYLNANKLAKPLSQTFYKNKDIWSVLSKFKKRQLRKSESMMELEDWRICF
jgi:hypothetical protein